MDRFDDDTLLAELRELRPTPRPEFTAELDERAAAGFPRRDSRAGANPFARLAERVRGTSGRRLLIPAVGLTIAVLAVAVVVVAIGSNGGSGGNLTTSATSESESVSGGGAEMSEAGGEEGAGAEAVETESTVHAGGPPHGGEKSAEKVPSATAAQAQNGGTVHGGEELREEGGAAAGKEVEESSIEEEPAEEAPAAGVAAGGNAAGPAAGLARGHRDVERSTTIVLGTKPDQVAAAAAKVYAAVHASDGIVLDSSVESGSTGDTGASFSLLIPSGKVDDALAAFSRIAEVRSRHDATQDITKPTVGVTEELRDSNASIEGLLKELGAVETEAERESVEARLREERRHHASTRASLEHLHKRASLSEVRLTIVTGHGAGVVPPSKGDGGWSVGDALHDAGNILTVGAGVLLIALAVLAPIALILLLLWSLNRFRVRRLRERALG
jgi:hypothetical protein